MAAVHPDLQLSHMLCLWPGRDRSGMCWPACHLLPPFQHVSSACSLSVHCWAWPGRHVPACMPAWCRLEEERLPHLYHLHHTLLMGMACPQEEDRTLKGTQTHTLCGFVCLGPCWVRCQLLLPSASPASLPSSTLSSLPPTPSLSLRIWFNNTPSFFLTFLPWPSRAGAGEGEGGEGKGVHFC